MKEIHYLLGNTCNLNCDFCFWEKKFRDTSLSRKKQIINEIVETGVKTVTISGGEPTCNRHLLKILGYCREKHLETVLHTNGLMIDRKMIGDLVGLVSRISLALDGSNEEIVETMRGDARIFSHTLSLIQDFNEYDIPVSVKTLITKINYDDILNIGYLLRDQPIKYWSLLEFNPVGRGKIFKSKYAVSGEKFDKLTREAKKQFPEMTIKINKLFRSPKEYCFIAANGDIYIFLQKMGDIVVGNIFDSHLKKVLNLD